MVNIRNEYPDVFFVTFFPRVDPASVISFSFDLQKLPYFGIPILGITDGDCDDLADRTEIFRGSVILRLAAGNDDIVGKKLRQELFKGRVSAFFEDIPALKEEVLRLAEPSTEVIFEY